MTEAIRNTGRFVVVNTILRNNIDFAIILDFYNELCIIKLHLFICRRNDMRALCIALLVVLLSVATITYSHAVGLYLVGKEDCSCSELVAKGIYPDTINKLTEALMFPQLALVLDKVGEQVQLMLANIGAPPTDGSTEAALRNLEDVTDKEEKISKTEAPEIKKSPAKKAASHLKKTAKKKKLRIQKPPRVM
jgi:hypothetical protein